MCAQQPVPVRLAGMMVPFSHQRFFGYVLWAHLLCDIKSSRRCNNRFAVENGLRFLRRRFFVESAKLDAKLLDSRHRASPLNMN